MGSFCLHSERPTRFASVVFAAKALLHRKIRFVSDLTHPVRRLQHSEKSDYPALLAEFRSPLWIAESSVENILQFGKVQNLRRACERLHTTRILPNEVFSFWKQVGKATKAHGYAVGRELREGCLIPTFGGGLCQLSNALYQLALQCGCEIIERHAHSTVVPGSATEQGRDATIFWNYVDFRFRPRQNMLIRAFLSKEELIVSFWGRRSLVSISAASTHPRQNTPVHTCTDCTSVECFRHVPAVSLQSSRSAFLIEECWPEFEKFVNAERADRDDLFLPFHSSFLKAGRYRWNTSGYSKVVSPNIRTALSAITARFAPGWEPVIAQQIPRSEMLARYYGERLSIDVYYIHVAQTLLPFLWRRGDLGGRGFSVFMPRLPLAVLHQRLDDLAAKFPDRKTFQEFRAPSWMVEAEGEALERAEFVVTPHAALATLFPSKTRRLEWIFPATHSARAGDCIVFPGPSVARKGAYELRDSLHGLETPLLVLNSSTTESEGFWKNVYVAEPSGDWLDGAAVVVQPAFIENNPRPLLRALAAGIPVIATKECGIESHPLLRLVKAGDVAELTDALEAISAHSLVAG